MKRIYLSSPHMGKEELAFVQEAFTGNWIAPVGPNLEGFEEDLRRYSGSYAVALSSGTAAIHLALILLGVQGGDEVLVSTFTFSASVNPIIYQGAIPVLVDSEPDTWNMSPELLEEAIRDRIKKGKKPKAILGVHLYGMPARMDEILGIARQWDIPVIEDAAEAMGSRYKGRNAGSLGDFGILSFNGNKIITTSGGGALVGADEAAIAQAHKLANQARDPAPHYEHSVIGYNYRMSNVLAGIGRGQMKVLDERVRRRREINRAYVERYGGGGGLHFLCEPSPDFYSNHWLTAVLMDPALCRTDPTRVREALEQDNIESRPLWKPMHLQPVFSDCPAYLNQVSERYFLQGLCLPSGSNMTEADLARIFGKLDTLFARSKH